MRSRWVRRGLWTIGFASLWLGVLDDPPLRTGAYSTAVSRDCVTIAKITSAPAQVECSVFDRLGNRVGRTHSSAPRRRHSFRFAGLSAGTDYDYTVSVDGAEPERGRVRTAPAEDTATVRIAFLGDSGGQPWWVWLQRTPILHLPARFGWLGDRDAVTRIGAAVAAYAPDFVLHLGDVVYPWGRHAHYFSGFFRPFAEVLRSAPVYAIVGNHDVMDADGQQLLANLCPPPNPETGDGRCFSLAHGPLRIIGLDCNVDRTGDRMATGHPSLTFLLAELDRCTEPWIVVATHFPMKSASRQRDRADLLLSLLPLLEERQVDLYLSGHDHCYQRFRAVPPVLGVPLVVSGGGGKDLYAVRPDSRAAVLDSSFHWCSLETEGASLRVRAHRIDGTGIDQFEVALRGDESLEVIRQRQPARAARIQSLRDR